MKQWKIIAGLLALFLCGVIVGAAGLGGFIRHALHDLSGGPDRHPAKRLVMRNIESRLDAGPATMDKISRDIDISVAEMQRMHKEFAPHFKQVVDDFAKRTAAYLTPEQHEKLVELMDDFKNRRRSKLKGPGWLMPMPPPPPWMAPPPHGPPPAGPQGGPPPPPAE